MDVTASTRRASAKARNLGLTSLLCATTARDRNNQILERDRIATPNPMDHCGYKEPLSTVEVCSTVTCVAARGASQIVSD
jgi:hypothetical protein